MWYSILEFLNVAGVVTNSFLVAFTSSYGRSWEGDPSTTNTTELVFNNATNTTEQVLVITQHLAGPSKLWLIIGFEVRKLVETALSNSLIIDQVQAVNHNREGSVPGLRFR